MQWLGLPGGVPSAEFALAQHIFHSIGIYRNICWKFDSNIFKFKSLVPRWNFRVITQTQVRRFCMFYFSVVSFSDLAFSSQRFISRMQVILIPSSSDFIKLHERITQYSERFLFSIPSMCGFRRNASGLQKRSFILWHLWVSIRNTMTTLDLFFYRISLICFTLPY